MLLKEVSRSQLLAQSKQNARYKRKSKSKILATANEYNKIDMNKLFKDDILEAAVPVKGETDNYTVTISYEGVIEELKKEVKWNKNQLDLRCCIQALQKAFNRGDVFTHCTCPDATYRMNYWNTVKRVQSKEPELRPSKITNPNDSLGRGCKHALLTLSRTLWILKTGSVLHNYIKYMQKNQERLYKKLIEPKIYDEIPEEDDLKAKQLSMFDDEEEVEEPIESEEPEENIQDEE